MGMNDEPFSRRFRQPSLRPWKRIAGLAKAAAADAAAAAAATREIYDDNFDPAAEKVGIWRSRVTGIIEKLSVGLHQNISIRYIHFFPHDRRLKSERPPTKNLLGFQWWFKLNLPQSGVGEGKALLLHAAWINLILPFCRAWPSPVWPSSSPRSWWATSWCWTSSSPCSSTASTARSSSLERRWENDARNGEELKIQRAAAGSHNSKLNAFLSATTVEKVSWFAAADPHLFRERPPPSFPRCNKR